MPGLMSEPDMGDVFVNVTCLESLLKGDWLPIWLLCQFFHSLGYSRLQYPDKEY